MRRLASLVGFAGIVVLVGGVLSAPPAQAGFAGTNGRIAFGSDQTGSLQVYSISPDGSGLRQLTRSGFNLFPDWSPNGTHIAFLGIRSGHAQEYVMRADGTHVTRVTHLPGSPQDPSWSPDGSRLIFEISPANGDSPNIYSIRVDGSGLRQITHFTKNVDPREPEYSPDGVWITFAASPAGKGPFGAPYALYLAHPNGTGLHRLTRVRLDAAHPEWSPDGSVIIFNDDFRKSVGDIFTVRPDGTHVTKLTRVAHKNQADYRPDYSPDGKQIVFSNVNPHEPGSVWIMNADGSDAHVLDTANAFAGDWGSHP